MVGTSEPSAESIWRSWGEEGVADLYAAEVVSRISAKRQRFAKTGSLQGELGEFTRYAPVLFFQLDQIAEEARYVHALAELPPSA